MSTADSTTRLRGVLYCRMSSDKQDDSIPQQLEWAEEACPRAGVEVLATFRDDGVSGHATRKRTGFHEMLAFCQGEKAKGRPVEVIACWHHNRFSRADSIETGWFLQEFRIAGVRKMFTAGRWIDFARREDRIILGVEQEASNNKYSTDLAEASTRGKLKKAKAGGWCGGRAPYGYRIRCVEGRDGRPEAVGLAPDDRTADVVRWLFATYAAGGSSLRSLIQTLNDRGEPTPSRALGKGQQAEKWAVPTVRNILTNEVYLGALVWNRTHQGKFLGVVDLKPVDTHAAGVDRVSKKNAPEHHIHAPQPTHDALVDEDTFRACARRLVEQRRNTTPRRGGAGLRLTGLLVCGHCERRMIGRHHSRTKRPMYLCGSYLQYGRKGKGCDYNPIDEAALVKALVAKLQARFTPALLAECRALLAEEDGRGTASADNERLERRLKELEMQVSKAARAVLLEDDDALASVYRQEVKRLQVERDEVARQRDRAAQQQEERGDPGEVIDRAAKLLADLPKLVARGTPAEVRAFLADHVEKVELWWDHEDKGKATLCTFARGLVWVREDSPFSSCLSTSNIRPVQARCIPLTSADLGL